MMSRDDDLYIRIRKEVRRKGRMKKTSSSE